MTRLSTLFVVTSLGLALTATADPAKDAKPDAVKCLVVKVNGKELDAPIVVDYMAAYKTKVPITPTATHALCVAEATKAVQDYGKTSSLCGGTKVLKYVVTLGPKGKEETMKETKVNCKK